MCDDAVGLWAPNMKSETLIAIYAAIVATSALLLNFRNSFESRPRLHLRLIADGLTIGGDPEFDEKNLIILTVTNRGKEATTITNMVVFKMNLVPTMAHSAAEELPHP